MRKTFIVILLAAILFSGFAALAYEVLWQRQMMLVFGASPPATTAILTAIFLGIALGGRAAARLNKSSGNPLVLYAVLEVGLGLWAFSVPWLLKAADALYLGVNHSIGSESFWIMPVRFVIAVGVVLPATLCMGAATPLIVRLAAEVSGPKGSSGVGWAYGVNMLGAVAGCLATGFVLIRTVGLHHTREVAVGTNLAVGALLLVLAGLRRNSLPQPPAPAAPDLAASAEPLIPPDMGRFKLFYFCAGFAALALEVVWLRFLGIINTNSNTTFTLAVAVFLAGMGLGSLVVYPRLRKTASARTVFGLANLGTAVGALVTLPVVYVAPNLTLAWIIHPAAAGTLSVETVFLTEAALSAALMLLPTIFMGMTYPAICDMIPSAAPERKPLVGSFYFWGTLGSVLGVLVTAEACIPHIGLHGTFSAVVALSALLFVAAGLSGKGFSFRQGLAAGIVILIALGVANWSAPVLKTFKAEKKDGQWLVQTGDPEVVTTLPYYKAGPSATVSVRELRYAPRPGMPVESIRFILVDDQPVASTDIGGRIDAVMLAHLPLLLHPSPRRALTVGFGSGGTSHSMTTHAQVKVDCVEIEPEVPRAAHLFETQNFGVLGHPRFHLILNDARDHLHAGAENYDVISTDVTNLQYKQNGSLYSVEYFQMMKDRLGPEGVACAWIPMAAISELDLRILLASFQKVFPHTSLWYMNQAWGSNFGLLIGTPRKLSIDYRRIMEGFEHPDIRRDLALIHVTSATQLIHCLQLDEDGVRAFAGDAPLHTDDFPVLEFTSPLSGYQRDETFRGNLAATTRLKPQNLLPLAVNVPQDKTEAFQAHSEASRAFCEFVAEVYAAKVSPNDTVRLKHMKAACEQARVGMRALPEDPQRALIYRDAEQALDELQSRLSSQ